MIEWLKKIFSNLKIAPSKEYKTAIEVCKTCNNTGIWETGNNDLPCHCPFGDTAVFNCGFGEMKTGRELRNKWEN